MSTQSSGQRPRWIGPPRRTSTGISEAAVRDRHVVASPCAGTKLPRINRQRVLPLTLEAVRAPTEAMPFNTGPRHTGRSRGPAPGGGLRTERRPGRVPPPPTDGRDPRRPPQSRWCHFPRSSSTRWRHISRPGPTDGLSFTTGIGEPIRRTAFSERVWRPAVQRAGLGGVTMHALRHFCVSLLIQHGQLVKTSRPAWGTPRPPRRWAPTRTCGRTPTTAPVGPWTRPGVALLCPRCAPKARQRSDAAEYPQFSTPLGRRRRTSRPVRRVLSTGASRHPDGRPSI